MIDIAEWAQSRYGFYVDRHWRGGRWILKRGPIKLADYHARLLRHVFTPDGDGRLPYDTLAICEPAKSGKSALCGLIAEYMALHGDGDIYMASNKKNQAASIMYRSLTDSVEFSPFLHLQPTKYEIKFRSGNTARAIPSNARTEAGARFSLAVFDELSGYVYQDSQRLWSEFKTDPTRLSSMKLAVGFAGYHDSVLWRSLLDRGLAGEPVPELADIEDGEGRPAAWRNGRHFTFWSHLCRQPWQTSQWIASQQASLLPSEFRRMIRTEFVSASQQAFVSPESWERCFSPHVKPLQAGDGVALILALDLAAGAVGGDCCALVAISKWGPGGYGVRYARKWDPPPGGGDFDYRPVEHAISWLAANCNPKLLVFDPYQAVHFVGTNRPTWKIQTAKFEQGKDRALADRHLYDVILSRQLYHGGDEWLTRHVLNAGVKVGDDGRMRLVKTSQGAKIDLAVALSMGTWWARRANLPGDPTFVEEARSMRLDTLVTEPAPQPVEVQPAALGRKLAAIAGRESVVLVYTGQRRATWSLPLKPTRRTVTLSAGNPQVQLSNAEARWLVAHPLGAEFEVMYGE